MHYGRYVLQNISAKSTKCADMSHKTYRPIGAFQRFLPICFVKRIGALALFADMFCETYRRISAFRRYVLWNVSAHWRFSALFADMSHKTYRPISAFQRFSPICLVKHIGLPCFCSMCPSSRMSAYYAWTLLVPWPPLRFKGIISNLSVCSSPRSQSASPGYKTTHDCHRTPKPKGNKGNPRAKWPGNKKVD